MFKLKINLVKLVSAVGIDYSKLRNLLAAKKWQEADEETAKLMLLAAKCEEKGWLDRESIQEFPWEDLHTIDKLWEEYSNGNFGFSVQNRIYQSLGGSSEYDSDVWETFRYIVGWVKKSQRLYYNDINFSQKAPAGHLPVVGLFVGFVGKGINSDSFDRQCALMAGLGGVVFDALASRILKCNQSVPVLPE
ncbi:MAG: GUN4 domain-containing protein [Microcoleus sp.]